MVDPAELFSFNEADDQKRKRLCSAFRELGFSIEEQGNRIYIVEPPDVRGAWWSASWKIQERHNWDRCERCGQRHRFQRVRATSTIRA